MIGQRRRYVRPATVLAAWALLTLVGLSTAEESVVIDAPTATLHWKAAQEEGVYGYLVYRAERRTGPFLRVSAKIVRTDQTGQAAAAPRAYTFVDRRVEPGRTYYYYLDVVSTGGMKQRFSGVVRKQVEATKVQDAVEEGTPR